MSVIHNKFTEKCEEKNNNIEMKEWVVLALKLLTSNDEDIYFVSVCWWSVWTWNSNSYPVEKLYILRY